MKGIEPKILDLTIIIIHYRSREILPRCIKSISYSGSYEIVVVDNQNDPEFMAEVGTWPKVRVTPFQGNLGFAKANNIAIQQSRSRYVMMLNADVFLYSDYIKNCITFLDDNGQYSSVQGKLLLERTPNLIDSTGNVIARIRLAYNRYHREADRDVPSGEIFGVCAAAALYRRSSLEAVKLQDEYLDSDFFAYLEDVDLDWRLRLFGFRAYFLNTAKALHIREVSSNNLYRLTQAFRNRLYLIIKNDTITQVVLNLIVAPIILLFTPHPIANTQLIPGMFRKRKHIQLRKTVSQNEVSSLFQSNPWGMWIKKSMGMKV